MRKNILLVTWMLSLLLPLSAFSATLVETGWLEKNLDSKNLVVLDMSDNMQYQRFHIPGAIHLPYQVINQMKSNRFSVSVGSEKISQFMGMLGITPSTHVVIYDDTGGLNAARLYWELDRINHSKLSILNGGLVKWIREGRKISFSSHKPGGNASYPLKNADPAIRLATLEDVRAASGNNKVTLLDVRSQEEYAGNPRYPRTGHVPGAQWWEWQQAVDFDAGFQQQSNKTLLASLAKVGIKDKNQPIIVYCQSAHRAAHSYFTLRELGFKQVRVYDGSMAEYQQTKLPLKTGMVP